MRAADITSALPANGHTKPAALAIAPEAPDEPPAIRINTLPNLPDEFWESREILRRIRQAARYAQAGPDIVLLAVLCRTSAMVSHNLTFNFGRGRGGLSLFGGAIGGTGLGKTLANNAAQDLILIPSYLARNGEADPRKFRDSIGVATGEGLIEAYMGVVEEETGERRTKATKTAKVGDPVVEKVRKQVRHNAYFFLDEGEMLAKIMDRQGQTIGPVLRSAWNGANLGQQLADGERTRFLIRFTYSVGLMIGFQPETVQFLLADGAAGTPQRFLWASGYDRTLPDEDFAEVEPIRLPIETSDGRPVVGTIAGPEWLAKQLKKERSQLLRGETEIEQAKSQETMARCKLAALLAVIDGRKEMTDEDWALAGMVWDNSCSIRDEMAEVGRRDAAERARLKSEAAADTAVAAHVRVKQIDGNVEKAARWIAKRIHEKGPDTERGPRRVMEGKLRDVYDLALNRAIEADWVVLEEGHLRTGGTRPV
jgi:hypothetical protein